MFNFFEIFLRKSGFLWQENVATIEKWIRFQILWIVLKKWNLAPVRGGGLRPRTPCGGRVISFKWLGRAPPPKKSWRRHWVLFQVFEENFYFFRMTFANLVLNYNLKEVRCQSHSKKSNFQILKYIGKIRKVFWLNRNLIGYCLLIS